MSSLFLRHTSCIAFPRPVVSLATKFVHLAGEEGLRFLRKVWVVSPHLCIVLVFGGCSISDRKCRQEQSSFPGAASHRHSTRSCADSFQVGQQGSLVFGISPPQPRSVSSSVIVRITSTYCTYCPLPRPKSRRRLQQQLSSAGFAD